MTMALGLYQYGLRLDGGFLLTWGGRLCCPGGTGGNPRSS
jgi:hypothetical protein